MDTREHEHKHEWLAQRFEAERSHLRAVAYRMLGSLGEADDAVQESWLRLSRSDTTAVENLGGWLTTVVARVCLDMLRSRTARREEPLEPVSVEGARVPEPLASRDEGIDPEQEALLADAVGLALLIVLDALSPAERVAFVLHDLFDVPFDEIAPIVGRSPTAARQLASRARRRVRQEQGQDLENEPEQAVTARPPADLSRQRAVVDAFLAASRAGDFDALLALLDPEVVFRSDAAAVAAGGPSEVRGAAEVARQFAGRARVAQPAVADGAAALVVSRRGELFLVLRLTLTDGRIASIEAIADPARLQALDLDILAD